MKVEEAGRSFAEDFIFTTENVMITRWENLSSKIYRIKHAVDNENQGTQQLPARQPPRDPITNTLLVSSLREK